MPALASFSPGSPTITVSVIDTPGVNGTLLPGQGYQMLITSDATNSVSFFKTGVAGVQAAVTDTPVLPGSCRIYTLPPTHTHIAFIAVPTGGANVNVTRGDGE
jgi:hypothetical protein